MMKRMTRAILLVLIACPIMVYIEILAGLSMGQYPGVGEAAKYTLYFYWLIIHWIILMPYAIYDEKKWASTLARQAEKP